MSTQQDIYAAGSESRPPMLNKENYVPWSSHLLRYAKSRPNGNLIHNSILNGPYVRKMIPEPDIYAAVDSCETAQEIWLRVQQMMKGSDIGIQEKKANCSTNGKGLLPMKGNRLSLTIIPEWSRHVTIVHQTKDLHTADYTQLYDFLKYNKKEVDELKAEQIAKNQDPLALMANSNNPYFRQYTGQNAGNPAGYNDVIENQVNQNAVQNLMIQDVGNQNGLIRIQGNDNLVAARAKGNAAGPRRKDATYLQTQLLIAHKEEEVNANYILMANLQQASTSGTQTDSAPVYDTDGSAEVHENYDNNEIFNMFTQEEHYTELLEPIPESHQVLQNDNDVISEDTSVEQGGETVEQHPVNFEETRALYESLYQNLATEVEKVNSVNCKLKETNADLTTELARYENQEKCFEINQEKYDKLERCYQQFVYQEQCLSKKINALLLSSETLQLAQESHDKMKQMNKEIKPTNYIKINHLSGIFVPQKALSREELYFSNNSKTVNVSKSFLIPNEDLSDDTSPSVARKFLNEASSAHQELYTIVREEIFPIVNQVDARLQNFKIQFLKEAAKFVRDFKSLAKEVDDSLAKHKSLEVEIERLLKAVVSQDIMIIVQNESVVDTSDLQTELERVDNTKTRRPQPRSNTKNDRVPSASKSSRNKNKEAEVEVEEHHRDLLLSKNNKHISSACNNIKIDSPDVISKVVCAMCKKCLISVNHDKCLSKNVNGKNSCGKNQKAKVSVKEIQKKYQPKVTKPKKVGTPESLATPKPRKPRFLLRWSPTGKLFNQEGKLVDSSESKSKSNGDNACTSNVLEPKIKRFLNSTYLLDRNDHVAAILGFGDLQWGNILITRVYFIEGFGHNLFSIGQFCDSDLEVAFRRNVCFIRNLEGVDLLKGDCSANLYTINPHEMASASPICLMARASSTKSWLWHQRLSHLNFDTINNLARNDLVAASSKLEAEITSSSYGFVWTNKNCQYKWKANDREDIGKLGAKGDIGFFIGYSADSCAYRVYHRRTKKIMETMNVSFDELSVMAF
nr:integrase, catalytic region, zinc finger, CCHC-type, peptidase aspartic, catalytic [Tanacetum cinerariifolium]